MLVVVVKDSGCAQGIRISRQIGVQRTVAPEQVEVAWSHVDSGEPLGVVRVLF